MPKLSSLQQRLITGLILLIIVGAVGILDNSYLTIIIMWIVLMAGSYELTTMYEFNGIDKLGVIMLISAITLILYIGKYDILGLICQLSIIMWIIAVPAILIFYYPIKLNVITIIAISILLFVPALYSMIVIYELLGIKQLVLLLAIAWVNDTSAYFIGRAFGLRQIAPHVSPGKTIEGAFGGLCFTMLYLLTLKVTNSAIFLISYSDVLRFAITLTIIGIIGDLFESWLKRIADAKDSGNLLPGHGGVLDRIDSMLAIMPMVMVLILNK